MLSKHILQLIYRDPAEWISMWIFLLIGSVAAWFKGEAGAIVFVVMIGAYVLVISDLVLRVFRAEELTVHWLILASTVFLYSAGLLVFGLIKLLLAFNLLGCLLSVFIVSVFYFTRE